MIYEYSSKIKKETEKFFEMTTFDVKSINVLQKDEALLIDIKADDPKILIGERGQTLAEIQHLLRILIRKKIEKELFIEIDINEYKKRKKEALEEIIKDVADEVAFYKKEKILPPMNPYERRIVHLFLQSREDVETESINEGENRRVVIKPRK